MPRTGSYNIREAVEDDIIDLTVLGKQFARESKSDKKLKWSNTKFHNFLLGAIEREDFCVFVLSNESEIVGMFIGFATPAFFSEAVQAVELTWYVDPAHRGSRKAIEMLDAYEKWATNTGAVCINLMSICGDNEEKVSKLYSRKGYLPVENTFMKEL